MVCAQNAVELPVTVFTISERGAAQGAFTFETGFLEQFLSRDIFGIGDSRDALSWIAGEEIIEQQADRF